MRCESDKMENVEARGERAFGLVDNIALFNSKFSFKK